MSETTERADPVVDTEVSGGTVSVGIRYDGVLSNVPLAADPLAGCSFHGPVTADHVRALLAISVAARVAKLDEEAEYAVVTCDTYRFNGLVSAVWPIDESPPPEVVEILTMAAVARLTIPSPTPRTAPDGRETPFLVHLPVWLWIDSEAWLTRTATASLGALGASATATARPRHVSWSPGEGSATTVCLGPGEPWTPDLPVAADLEPIGGCSHTYTDITPQGAPFELTATATYDLELGCTPALICNGVDLPSTLDVRAGRPVFVTQARGVITE